MTSTKTPTFPVPVVSIGISQIRSDNYYANALRTRLTQKKVTPKRKNMRVQPASPDASSPCQPVTPESDEPSLGSLLYPNLRQAQRDWADKQARTLTSEMEAESFDC